MEDKFMNHLMETSGMLAFLTGYISSKMKYHDDIPKQHRIQMMEALIEVLDSSSDELYIKWVKEYKQILQEIKEGKL